MKNMKVTKECERCGKEYKRSPSHAKRSKYCSLKCSNVGKKNTGRTHFKKGNKPWSTGKKYKNPKMSIILKKLWSKGFFKDRKIDYKEVAKKISATQQGISIDEWNGFSNAENRRNRKSKEYLMWRTSVFERDNYTCQRCGDSGCILQAHHIESFAKHKSKRFDINNGITVCRPCHAAIDPYYNEVKPKIMKGGNIMKNNIMKNRTVSE